MPEPLEFEDAWYVNVTVQVDPDDPQRVWIELDEPYERYLLATLTTEQAGAVRDWLTQFLERK